MNPGCAACDHACVFQYSSANGEQNNRRAITRIGGSSHAVMCEKNAHFMERSNVAVIVLDS